MPNNLGIDTKIKSLAILEQKLRDTAASLTSQSAHFPARYPFHLGRCKTSGNSFNQLPIPNNLGVDTKIKSLAILEPKLRDPSSLDYFTENPLLVVFKI